MIDIRDISYTEGDPGSPHVGGELLQTAPTVTEQPGETVSTARDYVDPGGQVHKFESREFFTPPPPGPGPLDIGVDITLATLGPIGWGVAGWLNRDKPAHLQLPTGQIGEMMLLATPAYGVYNLFVDKPEGGVTDVLLGGGGVGMVPKLPDLGGGDGGWAGEIFGGSLTGGTSIFNIGGEGGLFGGLGNIFSGIGETIKGALPWLLLIGAGYFLLRRK